jgi:hypothetical protein
MQKQTKTIILGLLLLLLTLPACKANQTTRDWKTFEIQEEPAIDITFKLPPRWHVDYAPTADVPGQWDVALVPPLCSVDQTTEYSDNCISLTIQIKGESDFDKQEFVNFVSQSIALNETGEETTILMGQNNFKVGSLTMNRYNHKFFIGEEEEQLSFIFFETESAYYYFASELPYAEREGDVAQQLDLLIQSIEVIN